MEFEAGEMDPFRYNLVIPRDVLDSATKKNHAMGPVSTREALVIKRHGTNKRQQ
ncbi:hypothetical protein J5491_01575 [Candidatus Saccharibacteria bacterium]|nr:hypothetical protein [Candidatus Saccharibacteria bacterium]